jgi:glycosyltransferase involved in cell wall biosynthesis
MEKEGIQKIMEGCEILVTPSHSEGMPNVIMEGMARGLSVIATDVGAVCDQVDDEMGWLLPPGNVQALESAINQAMSLSKEQLDQKRRLALEKVKENFTWEKVSQDTFDHLKQLVDQA